LVQKNSKHFFSQPFFWVWFFWVQFFLAQTFFGVWNFGLKKIFRKKNRAVFFSDFFWGLFSFGSKKNGKRKIKTSCFCQFCWGNQTIFLVSMGCLFQTYSTKNKTKTTPKNKSYFCFVILFFGFGFVGSKKISEKNRVSRKPHAESCHVFFTFRENHQIAAQKKVKIIYNLVFIC